MFALLISIIVSLVISSACIAGGLPKGSIIAYAILGFIGVQFLIGFLVRKKSKVFNEELQDVLLKGQKRISHKINQFQNKPGGNPKLIQRQITNDQQELYRQALAFSEGFSKFKNWNLFSAKQMSTMRLQFLYQLKEFDEVDQIFARNFLTGPVMSEPLLVAMKMARQYKNKDFEGAEKTYKRHILWFKGDRGALLYGVISWIYMKQGEPDKARDILTKGKESTYNETLARNWEVLSNNQNKKFSNAGFGDEWYSLYLENPPAPKRQQVRQNSKGKRRF